MNIYRHFQGACVVTPSRGKPRKAICCKLFQVIPTFRERNAHMASFQCHQHFADGGSSAVAETCQVQSCTGLPDTPKCRARLSSQVLQVLYSRYYRGHLLVNSTGTFMCVHWPRESLEHFNRLASNHGGGTSKQMGTFQRRFLDTPTSWKSDGDLQAISSKRFSLFILLQIQN